MLVSRTRSACGPDAVVRDGVGYRLGVAPAEVDSVRVAGLVRAARAALEHDAPRAAELATEALALTHGLAAISHEEAGPLREVRDAAADDVAAARVIRAQSLSRSGAHADALPALEDAHTARGDDESVLADLLRSEAVVRGPAAALERYESYRRDLRDRLGANPGELLRGVHRDVLALDEPVRSGIRYDASTLLGRDDDLKRLIALMHASRVVSIVGPGGLGKTRLAHVVGRDPTFPAALLHVLAQLYAGRHAGGENRLRDDPGDHQRQIPLHVAGDRAAEDVGEHRREEQRLERDVEELLRVAPHLLQRAPRHRQRLAHRLGEARMGSCGRDGGGRVDGRLTQPCGRGSGLDRDRAHQWTSGRESSVLVCAAPSAARSESLVSCPVIARKTSSSVGVITLTEAIPMSAWRSAITTSAA